MQTIKQISTLVLATLILAFSNPAIASNSTTPVHVAVNQQQKDGTQLVNQARELIAQTYAVSASSIQCGYSHKTIDGKYIYPFITQNGKTGKVTYSIVGGDEEGFLYEDPQ